MPRLLVVHHTPSPALHTLLDAVLDGGRQVDDVEVVARPALTASALDVLEADGIVIGAPVNLGMIAGALKHFFDVVYYPCLSATQRRPYGVYVHGNDDTAGALRAIEKITTGLRWKPVQQPVSVVGAPTKADLDACWELGASVAALLAEGMA